MDLWQIGLSLMTAGSIVWILLSNRIVYTAFALMVFLLSIACIFFKLGAEFLAYFQIIIAVSMFNLLYVYSYKMAIRDGVLNKANSSRSKIVLVVSNLLLMVGAISWMVYAGNINFGDVNIGVVAGTGVQYYSALVERYVLVFEAIPLFIVILTFSMALFKKSGRCE